MKEGELIKYVQEAPNFSHRINMTKLLKEAKKEFPEIVPIHRFEPNEMGECGIPLVQIPNSPCINDYDVDGIKLKKWFERWFGE